MKSSEGGLASGTGVKKDAQVILMLSEAHLSFVLLILFLDRLFLNDTKVSTPRNTIVLSLDLIMCSFPDSSILSFQVVEWGWRESTVTSLSM